ncbi:mitochondrial FAD carrier protein flx1 [Tilletia horrida]|nr:mitochondrial FAD carrier protein flx1 [Tilletia horrida]KAK0540061.1 mitochondrial FAD carrier protein flx1 [Tilletia horrida]
MASASSASSSSGSAASLSSAAAGSGSGSGIADTNTSSLEARAAASASSHPVNAAWSKAAVARDSVAAARAAFAERQAASAFTDDRPPPTPEEMEAELADPSRPKKKKTTAQAFLQPTKPSPTAPSFFASQAYDHAAAGIAAGIIATICMNPLDLIKTKFQVDTRKPKPLSQALKMRNLVMTPVSISIDMYRALAHIVQQDGWKGLYRGISPNVVGNASSWGLYFLWYTWIKEYMAARNGQLPDGGTKPLSAAQHLLAATESGAITALMTNPIWVVKTRMFTTTRDGSPANTALARSAAGSTAATSAELQQRPRPQPLVASLAQTGVGAGAGAGGGSMTGRIAELARAGVTSSRIQAQAVATASEQAPSSGVAYNTLWSSLRHIYATEGIRGLWKGAGLALVGVSNGAIQFSAYEQLKRWRTRAALSKAQAKAGSSSKVVITEETAVQLPNFEYVIISGSAKMIAITITYPYQVVRSRIQNHSTAHLYPNIPTCIRLTYANEGLRAFYKGMAANAFRILPGTCVTFVVYENVSWTLRRAADRRSARLKAEQEQQSSRSFSSGRDAQTA